MDTNEHHLEKVVASLSPQETTRLFGGQLPPEWLRTSFVDMSSSGDVVDRVFFRAELVSNAMDQLSCACQDGVPEDRANEHYYVPASWIMRQRPEVADQIQTCVERILGEYFREVA